MNGPGPFKGAVFLAAIVIAALSPRPIQSQEAYFRVEKVPNITDLKGFTGTCIYQDTEGFMWFGSTDGIYRYDGSEMIRFTNNPMDPHSLKGIHVVGICEDSQGSLWVVTQYGINRYDKRTRSFTRIPIRGRYDCATADGHGNVWVGTQSEGLIRVDIETLETFQYERRSCSEDYTVPFSIDFLLAGKDNTLWVNTGDKCLYRFDIARDAFDTAIIAPCGTRILVEDPSGDIWLPSHCGLYKLYNENLEIEWPRHVSENNPRLTEQMVRTFLIDREGNYWIRNLEGIYQYDQRMNLLFSYTYPERYSRCEPFWQLSTCFYQDRDGTLWFFDRSGIYKLIRQVRRFDSCIPHTYESNLISGVCLINDDSIFIGNAVGEGQIFSCRTGASRNLGIEHVIDAVYDHQGLLWIATRYQCVLRLKSSADEGFERFDPIPPESLTPLTAYTDGLFEDSRGGIWVTSGMELPSYFDRDSEQFIQLENHPRYQDELPRNQYIELELGTGELLAVNYGVYKVIPPFTKTSERTAIAKDVVKLMGTRPMGADSDTIQVFNPHVDPLGNLWLTSPQLGLVKLDPAGPAGDSPEKNVTWYTAADGLASNLAINMVADQSGVLWIGTQTGLSRFDPRSETIRNYYEEDGLPTNRFSGKAAIDSGERIYMGTRSGIICFHPDSFVVEREPSPVFITGVSIHGVEPGISPGSVLKRSVEFSDDIRLNYRQNTLSISFAVLNYIAPEQNQYKYRMEGVNDDWVYSGNRNYVAYSELAPGKYVFRVSGANDAGIWTPGEASLSLRVMPPPWKASWAYLLYTIVLMGMLFGVWRYFVNRARLKRAVILERMEKEQAMELEETKSRFFVNISHEFRTPLTLILGPVEQLLRKTGDSRLIKSTELGLIRRNAIRLQQLINQLLDISRLETGSVRLEVRQGDLSLLVRRIVLSFCSLSESRKIRYSYQIPEDPGGSFFDPDKVDKILTNLIGNAFKYTPGGGEINVSLSFTPRESPELAWIKVRDSGSGIPARHLDRIFDRFYQVETQNVGESEGTGIGLSLVKELLELCHGGVEVHSRVGEGTEFVVRFPVSREGYRADELGIPAASGTEEKRSETLERPDTSIAVHSADQTDITRQNSRATVLIVEDSSDLRSYIRTSLDGSYKVLEAANGQEGLERTLAEVPDLVITDLMMPVMNGLELCERVRQDERVSHIPLVMLTAKAELDDKLEGLVTGADDYLVKPFEMKELLARIQNLLEIRKRLSEKFRREFASTTDPPAQSDSMEGQFLQRTRRCIEAHLSDTGFGVEELGRELGFSRSQLYRKLIALTGFVPNEYIRNIRLMAAAKRFLEGEDNIKEVLYEVGFNTPSYFSRAFRDYFGMSPSEYLSANRS